MITEMPAHLPLLVFNGNQVFIPLFDSINNAGDQEEIAPNPLMAVNPDVAFLNNPFFVNVAM